MDTTVNDFLDEINKIVPVKEKSSVEKCEWQECFDKSSGYAYYWNTKTDEVTWDMPEAYRIWKQTSNKFTSQTEHVNPQRAPLLSSRGVTNATKIYKIGEVENLSKPNQKPSTINEISQVILVNERKGLMTSYNSESESEEETNSQPKSLLNDYEDNKKDNKTSISDEKKESRSEENTKLKDEVSPVKKSKQVTGFSLLASYGTSDDEDETITEQNGFNLFPIKDVKPNFMKIESDDTFLKSNKAFLRKKRINLECTTQNLPSLAPPQTDDEHAHVGFGYKQEDNTESDQAKNEYNKKRKILFVKSEAFDSSKTDEVEEGVEEGLENDSQVLSEKLKFLCEGREPASAVQVLIIQLETLNEALKAKCLSRSYFSKWLKSTCTELIKLEENAAPSGWSLQWDRLNKRYFYYNKTTGQNQWEYPQVSPCSTDAMDICTTPPPPPEETVSEAPPPPTSENPPPPPSISQEEPPTPPPPPNITPEDQSEPLPPGVEPRVANQSDVLGQELNCFYNDIAKLEDQVGETTVSNTTDDVKVAPKKRKKVKLSQGLSLKKKGVSKLVEKWKNVHKNL